MYEWREESAVQGGWRNAMGQFVNHVTLKGAGSVTHFELKFNVVGYIHLWW